MKMAKRVFLFLIVNILIVTTISFVTSLFGLQPYLQANGLNFSSLIVFCLMWGFGGAFISLAISRKMAKWMMGVQVIDPNSTQPEYRRLVEKVHQFSRAAGLSTMPEVGVYDGAELNAFATGPTKSRSLVAVSTGLLNNMNSSEVDGVLAHEVAHIANGDMVTMTLVQGVVNSFVMFLSRVAGHLASQAVEENKRPMVQFMVTIVLEILLGILGMMVVSYFSRQREYRADLGGASLASRNDMISALQRLKRNMQMPGDENDQPALATLKISGRKSKLFQLFSTHPDLDDRIQRLQSMRESDFSRSRVTALG